MPEPDGDLAVSLFKTQASAIEETNKWLRAKWQNVPLSLLNVDISGLVLTATFPFELITTTTAPIPPHRIVSVVGIGSA